MYEGIYVWYIHSSCGYQRMSNIDLDISDLVLFTDDIHLCTRTNMYDNDVNNSDVSTHTRDIFICEQVTTSIVFTHLYVRTSEHQWCLHSYKRHTCVPTVSRRSVQAVPNIGIQYIFYIWWGISYWFCFSPLFYDAFHL